MIFRLSDNVDDVFQDYLVVVDVLLGLERIDEIVK